MCGIVGYLGKKNAKEVIFFGLKKLEYRGYDSAGIALKKEDGSVEELKVAGKLNKLEQKLSHLSDASFMGLGHTRWATHGEPNERNAHPHRAGSIVIVHNGIIENQEALKRDFSETKFISDTDTEVFAHLVLREKERGASLLDAVRNSFSLIRGNSAFVVMDSEEDFLVAVCGETSPLLLANHEGESLVASDVSAIISHSPTMYCMGGNEIALLSKESIQVFDLEGKKKEISYIEVPPDLKIADKNGFPHFMLKEIHEQGVALKKTLSPWLDTSKKQIRFYSRGSKEEDVQSLFSQAKEVRVLACGTAYHAGMYARLLWEPLWDIPVYVELAHEFRYRRPVLQKDSLAVVISQSGETADSLAAAKMMKEKGIPVLCITNVAFSSLARLSDEVFLMDAGMEVGVASTKVLQTMMGVIVSLGLFVGKIFSRVSAEEEARWVEGLSHLPEQIEKLLKEKDYYKELSSIYGNKKNYLYIGRGIYYPVALEGALKLKELAYVHAEGFAGGELKHGPIALVDKDTLLVAVAPQGEGVLHGKSLANVQEVKSRKGVILGIGREDDQEFRNISAHYIPLPKLSVPGLYPLLAILPLQLLAYYISVQLGREVDQPRNLAKSVTVE